MILTVTPIIGGFNWTATLLDGTSLGLGTGTSLQDVGQQAFAAIKQFAGRQVVSNWT